MEEKFKSIKVKESVYNKIVADLSKFKQRSKDHKVRWSLSQTLEIWKAGYDESKLRTQAMHFDLYMKKLKKARNKNKRVSN